MNQINRSNILTKLRLDRNSFLNPTDATLGMLSLIFSSLYVICLCGYFVPGWETNDDAGMSMILYGYGIASFPSSNIVFSNVLWAHFIQLIPSIHGILGYSLATIGVLIISGALMLYCLIKLETGRLISLLIVIFLITRPVLFPQFTINSGLLVVSAILCWAVYAKQRSVTILVIGTALAFCSYLIRSNEFVFVLFLSLPLLPWKIFVNDRIVQITIGCLFIAIVGAASIDKLSYQNSEWTAFNSLNEARLPYTDFRAGNILKQNPDFLKTHGYSANDMDLIRYWFFVDETIADPAKLTAMQKEMGVTSSLKDSWTNGWHGIQVLWQSRLLPLTIAALLFYLLRPKWKIAAVWALSLIAFFCIGFGGRPGVLRVYVPVLYLLIIAPFIVNCLDPIRRKIAITVLLVATYVYSSAAIYESRIFQTQSSKITQSLHDFPNSPVVIFGGVFPFEFAFPVLGQNNLTRPYRFYGLNVFTLAPYAVSKTESQHGRDLITMLKSDEGVSIIADNQRIDYLGIYCKEHLNRRLKIIDTQNFGDLQMHRLQCSITP